MKSQATSLILILAVIVVVGGVAWFRTTSAKEPNPTNPPETTVPEAVEKPAGTSNADTGMKPAVEPAVEPPAASVKEGELCPEPPPVAKTDDSASQVAAEAAETKKLPRVVDLGADKCIPCKKLAPILEELKKEYEGRVVVEFIDVWKDAKAGEPYNIRLIPTQVFFDAEGKEVWRHEGFLSKEAFIAKFKELGVK